VERTRLLPLAHFWTRFFVFACRRTWRLANADAQSATRSVDDPNIYYASVTAHGSIMAYVFPTFFVMDSVTPSLCLRLECRSGRKMAWRLLHLSDRHDHGDHPVAAGRLLSCTLFIRSARKSLVLPGHFARHHWILFLDRVDAHQFRCMEEREPGKPVPLAMFAITACALLWVGQPLELPARSSSNSARDLGCATLSMRAWRGRCSP